MNQTQIRAVLFDRDGTIAETDQSKYQEAAQWLADTYGLDSRAALKTLANLWSERFKDWWGLRTQGEEDAFWQAYGDELTGRLGIPASEAAALMKAYPYERYMKPAPQAREVLSELRGMGLKIGVLSNTLPSIWRTLDEVGLSDLVDVALATCTLGTHKPEAAAFEWALTELNLPAEAVLFIDDLASNVEAAQAMGMRARLIDLTGANPAALSSLSEVPGLVRALGGRAE